MSTSKVLVRSQRKTDIRYLELQTSWKAYARLDSIPKSISDTLTTSSRFTRATNGKLLSALTTDLLNSVMPFRLTNAPAAFQRLMNNLFSDLLDICILVYLDNILIYSNILEEHHHHVHKVLLWLRNNKLYTCGDKCSIYNDTVEYLGFILSPNGLTMDPSKVNTVLEWPEPHKVKDIQSFLGFANFYRCYTPCNTAPELQSTHPHNPSSF